MYLLSFLLGQISFQTTQVHRKMTPSFNGPSPRLALQHQLVDIYAHLDTLNPTLMHQFSNPASISSKHHLAAHP